MSIVLLDEIGGFLQTNNVGTLGSTLFLGLMPDQPDDCVSLFEYAGNPPDLHWNGEYPSLQVRARSKDYISARSKLEDVINLLHKLCDQKLPPSDESVNSGCGTRYLLIKARGSPEILKRDSNGRVELFVNFEIIKERD
jgi:hypothetical protein